MMTRWKLLLPTPLRPPDGLLTIEAKEQRLPLSAAYIVTDRVITQYSGNNETQKLLKSWVTMVFFNWLPPKKKWGKKEWREKPAFF